MMRNLLLFIAGMCLAADWNQFLGPNRDGTDSSVQGKTSLNGSKQLWKKDVGAGFSAPVVTGERLILFHRRDGKEIVECLNAANGQSQWKFEYPTTYRDDFGFDEGPRGTPAIVANRVYTFGAEGTLHALDLATGKQLWAVDTHAKFGVKKAFFGAAASPLVDATAVYVNVGGPNGGGLVAFDLKDGRTLWSATNDEAGYSSPIAATIDGVRSIVCFTRAGLVALDPSNGNVRFQFPWRSRSSASVNSAVPVISGNLIFLSASYNTGAVLLNVSKNQISKVWSSDEALSSHYASIVQKDGFLYGFHGRQEFGQSLRCIEMKTGKVRWDVERFGAGTVSLLGDTLVVVRENGEAVTAPASPGGFKPDSKAQLLPAVIRSYPAISGGRIFIRNERSLAAYSITGAK